MNRRDGAELVWQRHSECFTSGRKGRILTGVEANVRGDEDGLRGNRERAGDLILKEVAVLASKFESIKDSNCGKNGNNTKEGIWLPGWGFSGKAEALFSGHHYPQLIERKAYGRITEKLAWVHREQLENVIHFFFFHRISPQSRDARANPEEPVDEDEDVQAERIRAATALATASLEEVEKPVTKGVFVELGKNYQE